MSGDQLLSKGFYRRSQVSGLVSVKEYIFARREGKKCLLLRFSNDSDFNVTAIRYTLVELDRSGDVIKETPVGLRGITLVPGATYSPRRAVSVDEECVDFKIVIEEVASGHYLHRVDRGLVTVHYVEPERIASDETHSISAKPFKTDDGRWSIRAATVMLILVFLISIVALAISVISEPMEDDATLGASETTVGTLPPSAVDRD